MLLRVSNGSPCCSLTCLTFGITRGVTCCTASSVKITLFVKNRINLIFASFRCFKPQTTYLYVVNNSQFVVQKNNADVKWSILMPLISIIIRNKSIWRFQNVKSYLLIHNFYLLFTLVSCKHKQNQFKSWKSLWSGHREIVRCGHTPKWLKNHFPRWNWPKLPRIWPKFPEKVKFMNFD